MVIGQLINTIRAMRPGTAFADDAFAVWISEVEGKVQTDIWLLSVADVVDYTLPEDANAELLVPKPHDKLYRYFLLAMIDLANMEYQSYANTYAAFNAAWFEYHAWYAQNINPASQRAEFSGYYVSAYSLAVKHGFSGSEAEWLLSLKGAAGEAGHGLEVRGRYDTIGDLDAAVPDPEISWAYAIGTADDNTTVIWNGSAWDDIGPVKGDPGDTGETGETGATGATGAAATVAVGTVSSGAVPAVVNVGDAQHAILNFTLAKGDAGDAGREVELHSADEYIQWRYVGDALWVNLVPLSALTGATGAAGADGTDGTDGREVAIRNSGSYIQWQYAGDAGWVDIVALADLKGATGATGAAGRDFVIRGYYPTELALEAAVPYPNEGDAYGVGVAEPYDIYVWDAVNAAWVNNGPIQGPPGEDGADGADGATGATGAKGDPGREVQIQNSGTYIQWRYVGDAGWTDIVALSALKGDTGATGGTGAAGSPGAAGADGREVEIQNNGTAIQWRYEGDVSWTNIVLLSALKGDTGAAGSPGATGDTGPAGPNTVSTATTTNITGILKGNGTTVSAAVSGTDYEAPGAVATHNTDAGVHLLQRQSVTASETLALARNGKLMVCDSASAITITVPTNASVAFPVGTQITIVKAGSGAVTIAAAAGVTIRSKDGKLAIDGQYAAATLVKTDTNEWYLWGALA